MRKLILSLLFLIAIGGHSQAQVVHDYTAFSEGEKDFLALYVANVEEEMGARTNTYTPRVAASIPTKNRTLRQFSRDLENQGYAPLATPHDQVSAITTFVVTWTPNGDLPPVNVVTRVVADGVTINISDAEDQEDLEDLANAAEAGWAGVAKALSDRTGHRARLREALLKFSRKIAKTPGRVRIGPPLSLLTVTVFDVTRDEAGDFTDIHIERP